jgi:hypothetical protein
MKISCVNCKHFHRGGAYEYDTCDAYKQKGSVPYQGELYNEIIYTAWAQCLGQKFERRLSLWQRLGKLWA